MPIYEYECSSCGRFEKLVPMSAPVPPCPTCEGAEVRKLVSATSFVLKGGGWYRDHYGLKSGGEASSAKGGEAAKGGGESAKGEASSSGGSTSSGDSGSGGSTPKTAAGS